MREGEKFGAHDVDDMCQFLADLKLLHHSGGPGRGSWHWTSDTYPAYAVSLRSVSSDNFLVIDITGDHQVIGEVAFTAALTTLHEKAIYLHDARQFQVERFDYDGRKAYVRSVDSDYFTDAIDYTQVKELKAFESAGVNGASAVRLQREGTLSSSAFRVSCQCFSTLLFSAKEILPSANVKEIACRHLERFPLRSADALQLAAALVWCGDRPRGRWFVCADGRLAAAATSAGFEVHSV